MTERQAFKDRLKLLAAIACGDESASSLLAELQRAIRRYRDSVITMRTTIERQVFRLSEEEMDVLLDKIEKCRQKRHDELMTSLASTNNYLLARYSGLPEYGVYSGPVISPEYGPDRYDVGAWALAVASVCASSAGRAPLAKYGTPGEACHAY